MRKKLLIHLKIFLVIPLFPIDSLFASNNIVGLNSRCLPCSYSLLENGKGLFGEQALTPDFIEGFTGLNGSSLPIATRQDVSLALSSPSQEERIRSVFQRYREEALHLIQSSPMMTFQEALDYFSQPATPAGTWVQLKESVTPDLLQNHVQSTSRRVRFEIQFNRIRGTEQWIAIKGTEHWIEGVASFLPDWNFSFIHEGISLYYGADYLFDILIHNHPDGVPYPSIADINSSRVSNFDNRSWMFITTPLGLTRYTQGKLPPSYSSLDPLSREEWIELQRRHSRILGIDPDRQAGVSKREAVALYPRAVKAFHDLSIEIQVELLPWAAIEMKRFSSLDFDLVTLMQSENPLTRRGAFHLAIRMFNTLQQDWTSLASSYITDPDEEVQLRVVQELAWKEHHRTALAEAAAEARHDQYEWLAKIEENQKHAMRIFLKSPFSSVRILASRYLLTSRHLPDDILDETVDALLEETQTHSKHSGQEIGLSLLDMLEPLPAGFPYGRYFRNIVAALSTRFSSVLAFTSAQPRYGSLADQVLTHIHAHLASA